MTTVDDILIRTDHIGSSTREGGNVHIVDGVFPGPWTHGAYGIGFGPVRMLPFSDSVVVVDELEFDTAVSGWLTAVGIGTLGAAMAVASPNVDTDGRLDSDDYQLSRRGVLSLVAVTGAMAAVPGAVSADEDDDGGDTDSDGPHNVARFDLETNPRGLGVRVDDVVSEFLPDDQSYYVDVNGSDRGSFGVGETKSIPSGITGEVHVRSSNAMAIWERLWSSLTADETLEWSIQLDRAADQYGTDDETVVLTSNPVIVDPIADMGRGQTRITIGDTTIPHYDSADERGGWYIRDANTLVYMPGDDAPPSELVEITIGLGRIERWL